MQRINREEMYHTVSPCCGAKLVGVAGGRRIDPVICTRCGRKLYEIEDYNTTSMFVNKKKKEACA